MGHRILSPSLFLCALALAPLPAAESAAGAVPGANLLPGDTSFETGPGGWMLRSDALPPAIEAEGGADGAGCLRLARTDSWLCTDQIPGLLPAGRELVLSFSARGTPGEALSCSLISPEWRWIAERSFPLGEAWTRHQLRIPAAAGPRTAMIAFGIAARAGDLRLDAIKLEEGATATPYIQADPLTVAAGTGHPGEVVPFAEGAPVDLAVRLCNSAIPLDRQPLAIECLVGEFPAEPVPVHAGALTIAPGTAATQVVRALAAARPGHFPVLVRVRDRAGALLAAIESPFAVVLPARPVAVADSFFGLQPFLVPQQALRAIGARWLRANGVAWSRQSEPEPGEVRIGAMPNGFAFPGQALLTTLNVNHPPAWAAAANGLPREAQEIAGFARQLAAAYRGGVACVELQNEPDLELATFKRIPQAEVARTYAELLTVLHPILHEAGIPLAMNVSGVGQDFARLVFQAAPHAFDVYAPHPYSFPRYLGPSALPAVGPEDNDLRGRLQAALALVAASGGRQETWIGELGWGIDRDAPLAGGHARTHAEFLARAYLTARSLPGIRRLIWFTALGALERDRFTYGIWAGRGGIKPLPAVAAYAHCAALLDGASPLPPIADGAVKAYAYAQGDRQVVALWEWQDTGNGPLVVRVPAGCTATSMTGSRLATAADGTLAVTVGSSPVYIAAPAGDGGRLAGIIAGAIRASRPVTLAASLADRRHLRLEVANQLAEPLAGSLALADRPAAAPGTPFRLAGGASGRFLIPLAEDAPLAGSACTIALALEPDQHLRLTRPLPALTPCRRGAEADPAAATDQTLVLDRAEQVMPPDPSVGWKGPDDLSARLRLTWDAAGLHLAAEVRDDRHHQPFSQAGIWKGDSIQFTISAANDARPGAGYGDSDHEFAVALVDGRAQTWRYHGVRAADAAPLAARVAAGADGILTYRVDIPWAQIAPLAPQPGRVFGFNLIVNDNDGAERAFCIGLSPGIADGKRPDRYRRFTLDE